jgi:hypothetical protein
MADLEGVVEILYHNHQERLKGFLSTFSFFFFVISSIFILMVFVEDTFDPLDTPHPPSAEPFDSALGYLGIGHVKAAYEKVVKSGDGLQLARLMQKTGTCFHQIE